jgi:hypothetical protein
MLLNRTLGHMPHIRPAIAIAQPNTMTAFLGGIDRGELPYIYHHLRKGCILQVGPLRSSDQRHLLFNVSYGGFHLGILSRMLADRILQLESEGRAYRLTIASIVREKYMPPTAVHVELEW